MSKSLATHLDHDIMRFRKRWGFLAVALVSCLAIAREGAEVVIYLYSMSLDPSISLSNVSMAALLACFSALALGLLIIQGTQRINLRLFFSITSFFLLVTAGSFIIQASHRFIELELLPNTMNPLWDMSQFISIESSLGSFLHFFMGYTPRPSLATVVIYGIFWLGIIILFRASRFRWQNRGTKLTHQTP